MQEVFRAVTPRYYDTGRSPVAALVLVGVEHWTRTVPVWPLLTTLAQGRAFSSRLHLTDDLRGGCGPARLLTVGAQRRSGGVPEDDAQAHLVGGSFTPDDT